jgi:hypothetical protein
MQQDERTHWQPIQLADGAKAYLEVIPRGGREEVGILEAIPFDRVVETLGQIANGVGGAIEKAKPSKAAVEIGVEFGLEAGKRVTLIARGTGKANLKVTLEWERP